MLELERIEMDIETAFDTLKQSDKRDVPDFERMVATSIEAGHRPTRRLYMPRLGLAFGLAACLAFAFGLRQFAPNTTGQNGSTESVLQTCDRILTALQTRTPPDADLIEPNVANAWDAPQDINFELDE